MWIVVDEETWKKAIGLLDKMPELKTKEEIEWKETRAGENLRLLSELLKRNAIPTKTLYFWCKIKKQQRGKKKYKWGKCWNWTGNGGDNTCNIGAEGAKMISEGLKSNSTLTTLDLKSDEKKEE